MTNARVSASSDDLEPWITLFRVDGALPHALPGSPRMPLPYQHDLIDAYQTRSGTNYGPGGMSGTHAW